MHTGNRKNHTIFIAIIVSLLLIITGIILISFIQPAVQENFPASEPIETIPPTSTAPFPTDNSLESFAKTHNLSLDEWPDSLLELLEKNSEAADFVLNYPLKKDSIPDIDLSAYTSCSEVPLFLQWDERWGYTKYGDELMGLSGCGPTVLSMVCMYLLKDPKYTPRYIADFAEQNGYCLPGNGSSWTLISQGGKALGLDVTEIPLVENRIIRNLQAGNPIICIMGPGDFTSNGHFIVMIGYADGKIKINDPNSPARSKKLWDYDAIKDQIRNLWVCC